MLVRALLPPRGKKLLDLAERCETLEARPPDGNLAADLGDVLGIEFRVAFAAVEGSLDACWKIHRKILPDWNWGIEGPYRDREEFLGWASVTSPRNSCQACGHAEYKTTTPEFCGERTPISPALAWLSAILRAAAALQHPAEPASQVSAAVATTSGAPEVPVPLSGSRAGLPLISDEEATAWSLAGNPHG